MGNALGTVAGRDTGERAGDRCGAGRVGTRWGTLRGGTRWSALGSAGGTLGTAAASRVKLGKVWTNMGTDQIDLWKLIK